MQNVKTMKKLIFFAAACCMAALFAACEKNDVESVSGTANGHDYVDLGLPSGTKWATCNVGATAPEEYGNYYAWGEITTKATYSWDNYSWDNYFYYSNDGKTVLAPTDDAAHVNWGASWRMPTDAAWTELLENCRWKWTDDYNGTGVAGQIVKSKINGNSIFLPAAGDRYNGDLEYAGLIGYYWSSSLSTDGPNDAWGVHFSSHYVDRFYYGCYYGQSVRPVLYFKGNFTSF